MCTTLCPSHPVQLAFLWIKQQPGRRTLFLAQHPLACYDDSPDDGGRSRLCFLVVPSFLFLPPFLDLPRQSLFSSLSFRSFYFSCFLFAVLLLFFSFFLFVTLFLSINYACPIFFSFYGLDGATLFYIVFFLYFPKKQRILHQERARMLFGEEDRWLLKQLLRTRGG